MPKIQHYESAVHQLLMAMRNVSREATVLRPEDGSRWESFISSLRFAHLDGRSLEVTWQSPRPGRSEVCYDAATFYFRGDTGEQIALQRKEGMVWSHDPVSDANKVFFSGLAQQLARDAGLVPEELPASDSAGSSGPLRRLAQEEQFHDQWASVTDPDAIDVRRMNEACTAPEMRYITGVLGDLRGRTLLDVGCGLGEASVYFALQGAQVTATDISQGMLDKTLELAHRNSVAVTVHKSSSEDLRLAPDARFDVIYLGNVLHHVDIDTTIRRLVGHVKPDGIVVSWDPVAYNPVINIYRRIASEVRTPDEHPLRLGDLRVFREHFADVRTRWFWLTTLTIFILMALVQRKDPNKERYWKTVVQEGERWKWLYVPLEYLDRALLAVLPFLRPLCWNVVVVARRPRGAEHGHRLR